MSSDYEILEKMAVGSFGAVFRIRRRSDGRVLVMKRIPLEDLEPARRHEATREITVMSDLHHPYIVCQLDAFLFREHDLCIVMEYYDGGDMDLHLANRRDDDEYFELQDVMLWFVQMLLAVHYLHSNGVIHRDLKTHNLFHERTNNGIAVGDFGIAERIDGSRPSVSSRALGGLSRQTSLTPSGAGAGAAAAAAAAATTMDSSYRDVMNGNNNNNNNNNNTGGLGSRTASMSRPLPNLWSSQSPSFAGASYLSAFANNNNNNNNGGGFGSPGPSPVLEAMRGTPLYMAPEVLQGGEVGTASDVWSIGCILYELLALRHPFESRDIGGLVVRVTRGERDPLPAHYPACVRDLVAQMLAADPRARPSCAELLRTPCVWAYVELLVARRANMKLSKAGSKDREKNKNNNKNKNKEKSDTNAGGNNNNNADNGDDDDASPRGTVRGEENLRQQLEALGKDLHNTLTYIEVEQQLQPPQRAPSAERELIERRQAAALTAAYSERSLSTSQPGTFFLDGRDGAGGGNYYGYNAFPGNSPLKSTGLASFSNGGGGGGGGGSAASFGVGGGQPMQPTASMKPYMVFDGKRPSEELPASPSFAGGGGGPLAMMGSVGGFSNHNNNYGNSINSSKANGGGGGGGGELTTEALAQRRQASMRARPSIGNAQEVFFATHPIVADMRHAPTHVIAREVQNLRATLQHMARVAQHLSLAQRLVQKYGPQLTHTLPYYNIPGIVAAGQATASGATEHHTNTSHSNSNNNHHSASNADASGSQLHGAGNMHLTTANTYLSPFQQAPYVAYADSMPAGRMRPRELLLSASGAPATADPYLGGAKPAGRLGPDANHNGKNINGKNAREAPEASPPRDPRGHPSPRRSNTLFPSSSSPSSSSSASPNGGPAQRSAAAASSASGRGKNRNEKGNKSSARPGDAADSAAHDTNNNNNSNSDKLMSDAASQSVAYANAYLERRRRLVEHILTVLDPPSFIAVYNYYREFDLLRRDPVVVMGWAPQRRQWAVLPAVEEVVVLDKFFESSAAVRGLRQATQQQQQQEQEQQQQQQQR